jgi:hypothetical protein
MIPPSPFTSFVLLVLIMGKKKPPGGKVNPIQIS